MKANLAELCSNIGELSRRVDRLELALDISHDLQEQRQRQEWQQQRDHDLATLKAHQKYDPSLSSSCYLFLGDS
jgi:hypothetical protein